MTTPFPFTAGQVLTAAELNDITNLPINDQTASYVLVAGDAGKRVIMNNAGATTITVNDSVFATGDTIFIANKGAGTCTITAGTATVNTSGSLALAQYGGGTLVALSASTFTFFPSGGIGYGTATGGSSSSITVGGDNYTLLTFTTDGTLTVSKAGLFDVLLVGGGAAGSGTSLTRGSGGGGGGQVIGQTALVTVYLAAASYTVDVGAGGAGAVSGNGTSGAPSEIETLLAACGGLVGTTGVPTMRVNGSTGGSRDSFAAYQTNGSINVNNGGGSVDAAAGGGGGAAGAGGSGGGTTGGAGGNGLDISGFIGGSTYYAGAGGGGGASTTGGAAGNGGVAGKTSGTGNSGVNYGAAGGGTYGVGTTGGNGAAGAVWVRFKV